MNQPLCAGCGTTEDIVIPVNGNPIPILCVACHDRIRMRPLRAAYGAMVNARAEVLRPIFAELDGLPSRDVARELNARGIAAPTGRPWTGAMVLKVRQRLKEHR